MFEDFGDAGLDRVEECRTEPGTLPIEVDGGLLQLAIGEPMEADLRCHSSRDLA